LARAFAEACKIGQACGGLAAKKGPIVRRMGQMARQSLGRPWSRFLHTNL